MVREARAFPDLPLRAVGYASRGASGRMTVIALGESADPAAKITAATVALVDQAGKLVAQTTAGEKELAQSPIVIATAVPPGTYRLRFAAVDATGRAGAADYPLMADFTAAGPLKLGSLMVGSLRNNSMTMALQFRDEEKVVGYLEMYGQITGQVKARMEVAATPDGPAIATVQPGGAGTSEPDRFILTAEIPIASLAPGDYVLRAILSMADQPEGKVMKTFRKAAR
jgi:5-hydroxyisourate hydrolase-like protein (transthyretin family)